MASDGQSLQATYLQNLLPVGPALPSTLTFTDAWGLSSGSELGLTSWGPGEVWDAPETPGTRERTSGGHGFQVMPIEVAS